MPGLGSPTSDVGARLAGQLLDPTPVVAAAPKAVDAAGVLAREAALRAEAHGQRLGVLGGYPAIDVWHGSPHLFPPTAKNPLGEFDPTKIGTGEGAQAYAYGHYSAEAKGVGKGYKKSTSYADQVRQFRQELPDDATFEELVDMAARGEFSPSAQRVIRALQDDDWLGFEYPSQAINAAFRELRSFPDASKELVEAVNDYGHLYRADLADEAIPKMLDWDKPLSEQPESVRKALSRAPFETNIADQQSWSGRDFIDMAEKYAGSREGGAKLLSELGIPGIRYLDQGSRGAGEGTRNFVVFPGNEHLLDILERDGITKAQALAAAMRKAK